jgi:histidinol-phosphate aminotransferase
VFSEHAFAVYPIATQAVGAQAKVVPAKDWGHDLPAMLAAIDANTRVVFIANPNNPTGTWFGAEALDEFLQDVPEHVLVVLDEAYIEYAGRQRPAGRPDFWRRTRTWYRGRSSKAYGLAALRVGYGLSTAVVADVLTVCANHSTSTAWLWPAACAALKMTSTWRKASLNEPACSSCKTGFRDLGLSWILQGQLHLRRSAVAWRPGFPGLAAEGVIVRPVANYGMPNHLRVTIGLPAENSRFLEALAKVLARG